MSIFRKTAFVATACVISFLFSPAARAEKKVGIFLFSEETRYQEAAKGIMDKLHEEGFGEPATTFIMENAGANKARAVEIVRKFAAGKMDLIFTVGTSSTLAMIGKIKDVPVVFATVYDPVETGIAKGWKSSGNNTTGTSTKLPMSILLDNLKEFGTVKRLAVLYTPGEKNSEATVKDMQEIQSNYQIKIVPVPMTRDEDVAQVLPAVIHTSDAIFITGSNLIDSKILMIVNMATKANVVTISHLADLIEKGVLLGITTDSYAGGRLAAEKAIRIFKGSKPSSLPIETLKKYQVMLNMKTLQAGQFQIPQEFMKKVNREIK